MNAKGMRMRLQVAYEFVPPTATVAVRQVMDHFGIGVEQGRHEIVSDWELPLEPGQLVCFVGDSGSGKSSLLRATARQLTGVVDIQQVELEEVALIDALPLPFAESLNLLSSCGLSEAQLILRRPAELSEGQRYRFRMARAIAEQPAWVLADEFTSALDRTTAKVIAFNVRRLCDRLGIGFLTATTHEDVLDDLQPDLCAICRLGSQPELIQRTDDAGKKKNQLCGRPVDQPGDSTRLAVLRSVALPRA